MREYDPDKHDVVSRDTATINDLLDAIFELIKSQNLILVRHSNSKRMLLVRNKPNDHDLD